MKKAILMSILVICVASMAYCLDFDTYVDGPFRHETELYVNYYYSPDNFYKFKFSDVYACKDSDYNDLFASPGLDMVVLSTLDNGRLRSDRNTYIYWMSDRYAPINRMTVEIPSALRNGSGVNLDWYAVVDGALMIGGSNGYGPENAGTIYQRDMSKPIAETKDSVQLKLWTDDITGKPAGEYTGSLVLRVIGEN